MNELLKNSQFDKHTSTYINRFIQLRSAADMLSMRLFPNAKEITESFGAYAATTKLEGFDWKDDKIICVVVGDGQTPRTGALFAFLTKWNVWSIDPEMKEIKYPINRLFCRKTKVEDWSCGSLNPVVIICVHSHAKLSDCLKVITSPKRSLVNIPCCFKSDLKVQPNKVYQDANIWSQKNQVEIYQNI